MPKKNGRDKDVFVEEVRDHQRQPPVRTTPVVQQQVMQEPAHGNKLGAVHRVLLAVATRTEIARLRSRWP